MTSLPEFPYQHGESDESGDETLDERQASTLRIGGATLLALVVLAAAWAVVAIAALKLGAALGLARESTERLIQAAWFVGPPVGGFLGVWAAASLVRSAPVRPVFIAFSIAVTVICLLALAGFVVTGGFTEVTFTAGMLALLVLTLAGAWWGRRVAERGRGG